MRNIVKLHVDPYGVNLWRYFDTDNFWDINQHQKMLIEMGVAGVRPVIHPTTGASTVANITTESQRYFRIVNTILIRQLLSDFLSEEILQRLEDDQVFNGERPQGGYGGLDTDANDYNWTFSVGSQVESPKHQRLGLYFAIGGWIAMNWLEDRYKPKSELQELNFIRQFFQWR